MRQALPDELVEYPDLDDRRGVVIKKSWKRTIKHKIPIHEIDPDDPELDQEEIWNDK